MDTALRKLPANPVFEESAMVELLPPMVDTAVECTIITWEELELATVEANKHQADAAAHLERATAAEQLAAQRLESLETAEAKWRAETEVHEAELRLQRDTRLDVEAAAAEAREAEKTAQALEQAAKQAAAEALEAARAATRGAEEAQNEANAARMQMTSSKAAADDAALAAAREANLAKKEVASAKHEAAEARRGMDAAKAQAQAEAERAGTCAAAQVTAEQALDDVRRDLKSAEAELQRIEAHAAQQLADMASDRTAARSAEGEAKRDADSACLYRLNPVLGTLSLLYNMI